MDFHVMSETFSAARAYTGAQTSRTEETPMFRTLLAAIAAIPLLMGCTAFAQAGDLGGMSPAQLSLIDGTCRDVMGLYHRDASFQACQDSLSHSLARRDAAFRMSAG